MARSNPITARLLAAGLMACITGCAAGGNPIDLVTGLTGGGGNGPCGVMPKRPKGNLAVVVRDEAGRPLEGRDVDVRGADAAYQLLCSPLPPGASRGSARSDAKGRAEVSGLVPGAYVVTDRVSKRTTTAKVTDGGNATVELKLSAADLAGPPEPTPTPGQAASPTPAPSTTPVASASPTPKPFAGTEPTPTPTPTPAAGSAPFTLLKTPGTGGRSLKGEARWIEDQAAFDLWLEGDKRKLEGPPVDFAADHVVAVEVSGGGCQGTEVAGLVPGPGEALTVRLRRYDEGCANIIGSMPMVVYLKVARSAVAGTPALVVAQPE